MLVQKINTKGGRRFISLGDQICPLKESFHVFADKVCLDIDFLSNSLPSYGRILRGMGNDTYGKSITLYFIDRQAYSVHRNGPFRDQIANKGGRDPNSDYPCI